MLFIGTEVAVGIHQVLSGLTFFLATFPERRTLS